jgi:hypothetical protein
MHSILIVAVSLASLAAAIPPDCPPPTLPAPQQCSLTNTTSSGCQGHQACVPDPTKAVSDVGICVGQGCGGFDPGSTPNCKPCPQNQVCAYNFTFLPLYPGYCTLPTLECAGPENKQCPEGNWTCTRLSGNTCGNPSEACTGSCTPTTGQ